MLDHKGSQIFTNLSNSKYTVGHRDRTWTILSESTVGLYSAAIEFDACMRGMGGMQLKAHERSQITITGLCLYS